MENNDLLKNLLQELDGDATQGQSLRQLAGSTDGFGSDFADRATAAAFAAKEDGLGFHLPRMFRWVVLTGAAAAMALLIITWYNTETIDGDAVAGISELSVDDVFAENLF